MTSFSDCKLLLLCWVDHWFSIFYIHVDTNLYDILSWVVPRLFVISIVLVVVYHSLSSSEAYWQEAYIVRININLMDKCYIINLLLLLVVIPSNLLPLFFYSQCMLHTVTFCKVTAFLLSICSIFARIPYIQVFVFNLVFSLPWCK